jgi:hypothetical protein
MAVSAARSCPPARSRTPLASSKSQPCRRSTASLRFPFACRKASHACSPLHPVSRLSIRSLRCTSFLLTAWRSTLSDPRDRFDRRSQAPGNPSKRRGLLQTSPGNWHAGIRATGRKRAVHPADGVCWMEVELGQEAYSLFSFFGG